MANKTLGTLFAGGGGVDIGAMEAGLQPRWAIEYDADIADVYRRNLGDHVTVADILNCDPLDFEPVDILHASPPCPNFSVAKAGGKETEQDVTLGRKVAEFIEALCPAVVTLENVYGYRKAESFRVILQALKDNGYHVRWWHLNSADFGVPQTRKRLILVARQGGVPQRPAAAHAPAEDIAPMFDERRPWIGWYEAIEDLIPGLPDSEFAPWQLSRLPDELKTMLHNSAFPTSNGRKHYDHNEPAFTVDTMTDRHARAFVMWSNGNLDSWGRHHVEEEEPALTVSPQTSGRARAFVFPGGNPSHGSKPERYEEEPSHTIRAGRTDNLNSRAFVVNGENAGNEWGKLRRDDNEPHYSLSGNSSRSRAHVAGRVVQMTPRALARFQSFPDWYELPESKTLACRVIGNAVPPLLYQRVLEANNEL